MGFGIYIHIPYCIQRCPYCDFATYQKDSIMPYQDYLQLLYRELQMLGPSLSPQKLTSVYFGGGTPSLLLPSQIQSILTIVSQVGFEVTPSTEVTIEINPGSVDQAGLEGFTQAGVNRFSVGAQTFDPKTLDQIGREHTVRDTVELLSMLQKQRINYTADLMFALPHQTRSMLELDIATLLQFEPNHISAYCLTVGEKNPLYDQQPDEDHQVEMFEVVYDKLQNAGYEAYEISNFCKPGFPAKHNSLYWSDDEYWGVGLSAHSYTKKSIWGERFWNVRGIGDYQKWVEQLEPGKAWEARPEEWREVLTREESLSDFCHTALRMGSGLPLQQAESKYGAGVREQILSRTQWALDQDLLELTNNTLRLRFEGRLKSNKIFESLHFSDTFRSS